MLDIIQQCLILEFSVNVVFLCEQLSILQNKEFKTKILVYCLPRHAHLFCQLANAASWFRADLLFQFVHEIGCPFQIQSFIVASPLRGNLLGFFIFSKL